MISQNHDAWRHMPAKIRRPCLHACKISTHQLGFRRAGSCGAGLGDAIKGDKALPGDVVNLLGRLVIVQHLHKCGGQVPDMAQLGDLRYSCSDQGLFPSKSRPCQKSLRMSICCSHRNKKQAEVLPAAFSCQRKPRSYARPCQRASEAHQLALQKTREDPITEKEGIRHLLAAVGHGDRPAGLDSVEEPLLDWVVVEGP